MNQTAVQLAAAETGVILKFARVEVAEEVPVIRPANAAVRPYVLKAYIGGVRSEFEFSSDAERTEKAAFLIEKGCAVVLWMRTA
jgi:hypothetical protein